jgi:hypothetical protein
MASSPWNDADDLPYPQPEEQEPDLVPPAAAPRAPGLLWALPVLALAAMSILIGAAITLLLWATVGLEGARRLGRPLVRG